MKKFFLGLLFIVLILVIIVLVRTFTTSSKQVDVASITHLNIHDSAIVRLQQAIQVQTISRDQQPVDTVAFNAFHQLLKKNYPVLFSKANVEYINTYSLLFHIKGQTSDRPVILMGHQDVVPVEEASLSQWTAPPFEGLVKDGFIYGRGAIDDKGSIISIMEAAEQLLKEGFIPTSDIYLAFGHDEEASGQKGGKVIATLLKQRNIRPAFVLDEGGIITATEIPGMTEPVALIGIAEKGYVTLDLTVNIPGGHSSMPAKRTAIDELAEAVAELKEEQFPQTLEFTSAFMDHLGPEMPFVNRMAFANRWLFAPMIKNIYSKKAGADAMTRTTTAPTIFNAGVKDNVIPTVAKATVNFRTLPSTSVDDVVKHVKDVIDNDNIKITVRPNSSSIKAVADVNDASFNYMQKAIRSWRKDVKVAPYLVLGATDGRFYTELTPQVYRFIPFTDVKGFHGINERIGVDEYKKAISFYYWLMKNYTN